MLAGVAFSALTAVSMSAGNLLEKHAVDHMAELSVRRAGRMALSFVTSRVWMAGFVISLAGLGFQVIAFALAPLAVVQSIYGAGLVLLVVVARLALREPLGWREGAGLCVIVAAVVLVGLSLGTAAKVGLDGSAAKVLVVAAASAAAAVGLLAASRSARSVDPGIALGVASGLFYGVAALGTKGASTIVARDGVLASVPHLLVSPYPYLFVAASVVGLVTFQTGLQRSRVGLVAPLSSVVSSTFVVAAGMALFAEPLPGDPASTAARLAGFAGVLVGTVLLALPGAAPGDGARSVPRAGHGADLGAGRVGDAPGSPGDLA